MTHDECLTVVRARIEGSRPDVEAQWNEAERHLLGCSDCWIVFDRLCETIIGTPLPDRDRVRELFGCDGVHDRMHALVAIDPTMLEASDPDAARHLAWCHACRDRLAELAAVEMLVGTEELSPTAARGPAAPGTIVGHVVVGVRRGLAIFTRVSDGIVPLDVAVPVGLRRPGGLTTDPGAAGAPRTVNVATPGTDSGADLVVHPAGHDRIDLEVRLRHDSGTGALVALHALSPAGRTLVACRTPDANGTVLLPSLPPGRYAIELPSTPPACVELEIAAMHP